MNITLGTAQFIENYGISNLKYVDNKIKLIDHAINVGIRSFDTSPKYSDAENVLGAAFKSYSNFYFHVVTKYYPKSHFTKNSFHNDFLNFAYKSRNIFGGNVVMDILLHLPFSICTHKELFIEICQELQSRNLINKFGISVSFSEDVKIATLFKDINLFQLPFNLLDPRSEELALIIMNSFKDPSIDARSIYLQGLLLSNSLTEWEKIAGANSAKILTHLNELTFFSGCNNIKELIIRHILSKNYLRNIIIGVRSIEEINENISIFYKGPLEKEINDELLSLRSLISERIYNPVLWNA